MGRLVSGNKTEVKKCRKCRRIVKNGSTTLHASDSIKKRENRENVRFSFFDVPKTQEKKGKTGKSVHRESCTKGENENQHN